MVLRLVPWQAKIVRGVVAVVQVFQGATWPSLDELDLSAPWTCSVRARRH